MFRTSASEAGTQRKRLRNRAVPDFIGQNFYPENQVDAHGHLLSGRAFRLAHNPVGLLGMGCRVAAVHPSQNSVVERLHPETYPVYAEVQKRADIFPALLHDVLRIRLEGELSEPAGAVRPDGLRNLRNNSRRQYRWGTASYIKRGSAARFGYLVSPFRNLPQNRF